MNEFENMTAFLYNFWWEIVWYIYEPIALEKINDKLSTKKLKISAANYKS